MKPFAVEVDAAKDNEHYMKAIYVVPEHSTCVTSLPHPTAAALVAQLSRCLHHLEGTPANREEQPMKSLEANDAHPASHLLPLYVNGDPQ
jgi:hypothetical protein